MKLFRHTHTLETARDPFEKAVCYQKIVARVILKYCNNRGWTDQEAEEILQDCYFKLWRYKDTSMHMKVSKKFMEVTAWQACNEYKRVRNRIKRGGTSAKHWSIEYLRNPTSEPAIKLALESVSKFSVEGSEEEALYTKQLLAVLKTNKKAAEAFAFFASNKKKVRSNSSLDSKMRMRLKAAEPLLQRKLQPETIRRPVDVL